jgi:hypothetical protein
MADLYVALIGVEFTIAVFLAGGIAAVAQVLATQVADEVTGLIRRSRTLWLGLGLLVASTLWSVALAILISGGSLRADDPWAGPIPAFLNAAALGVALIVLGMEIVRALRLLDPIEAVRSLRARTDGSKWAAFLLASKAPSATTGDDRVAASEGLNLDPVMVMLADRMATGRDTQQTDELPESSSDDLATFQARMAARKADRLRRVLKAQDDLARGVVSDPLRPWFAVVERSAVQQHRRQFCDVFTKALDGALTLLPDVRDTALTSAELRNLAIASLYAEHVDQVVLALIELRRWDHIVCAAAALSDQRRSRLGSDVNAASARLVHNIALALLEDRVGPDMGKVMESMGTLAVAAATGAGPGLQEQLDEVCRAIAEIGQRAPAAFHHPGETVVDMMPHMTRFDVSSPVGAVLDALSTVRETIFLDPSSELSPTIWVNAVQVTARSMVRHSYAVLGNNRLEDMVLGAVREIDEVGVSGARTGNSNWAGQAAYALAHLALEAPAAMWREYPLYLALSMIEIAAWCYRNDVPSFTPGQSLGDKIVVWVAERLVNQVDRVLEDVRAGRFDDAGYSASKTIADRLAQHQ